ncbi:MAG: hypothetical protein IIB17_07460 [Chloroflexi bacterium]|nr:hypothetical protein [Chloroflexota bacterium]
MKTLIQSALKRIVVAIDYINGVDRSAFQHTTLSSAEMDAIHQTMVR